MYTHPDKRSDVAFAFASSSALIAALFLLIDLLVTDEKLIKGLPAPFVIVSPSVGKALVVKANSFFGCFFSVTADLLKVDILFHGVACGVWRGSGGVGSRLRSTGVPDLGAPGRGWTAGGRGVTGAS